LVAIYFENINVDSITRFTWYYWRSCTRFALEILWLELRYINTAV